MQKNSGAGKSPAEPVLVTIDCSHLEENARDSMSPAPHDIAELEPAELESLLAASEGGFIGHVIFWGRPLNLERLIRYNVAHRGDLMTRTILSMAAIDQVDGSSIHSTGGHTVGATPAASARKPKALTSRRKLRQRRYALLKSRCAVNDAWSTGGE